VKLVVLAAALLVVQEKDDATETFKRLDEALAKAETVQASFKSTFEQQRKGREKVSGSLTGSIRLQKGNKARLEFDGTIGGPLKSLIVSDGTTTAILSKEPGTTPPSPTDPGLHRTILLLLSRIGSVGVVMEIEKDLMLDESERHLKGSGLPVEPRETDPLKSLKLGAFKKEPGEKIGGKETILLQYQVEEAGRPGKPLVKLWIDAASLLPLRRHITEADSGIRIEETYESFKLDEKIDAAHFELPKAK
jgi:outer membrane lipoprotein-sorting protein